MFASGYNRYFVNIRVIKVSAQNHTILSSSRPWQQYRASPIHYVSFSAGAMAGLALVGSWLALEDLGVAKQVRGFSGSSMGSIIALLCSVGYTGKEQQIIAHRLKYENFASLQVLGLFDNMGIETGTRIMEFLSLLVARKISLDQEFTFKRHWEITGRKLVIAAACVENHCCDYFSVDTEPEMSVLLAVRMSIAIPWLFTAVRWRGKTYVDAGLYDPCPAHVFPAETTLVLQLNNATHKFVNIDTASTFIEHSAHILYGVYRRLHQRHFEDLQRDYRCIIIDTHTSALSLSMPRKDRRRVVSIGYVATMSFLRDFSALAIAISLSPQQAVVAVIEDAPK